MIASPLRPRHRQESGIAAAGQLAHRGTPYGASLSFATTTHLWPLSDPPSRKPPQRIPSRTGTARSIPGRALASSVSGSPCQGPGTGLPPPISTSVPGTPTSPRATRSAPSTTVAATPPNRPIRQHPDQQQQTRGGATSSVYPGATASGDTHPNGDEAEACRRLRTRVESSPSQALHRPRCGRLRLGGSDRARRVDRRDRRSNSIPARNHIGPSKAGLR